MDKKCTSIWIAVVGSVDDTALAFTSRDKAVDFCIKELVERMEELGTPSIKIEAMVQKMKDSFEYENCHKTEMNTQYSVYELELC